MADNLLWVEQRESSRGKVFFFAHDAHLQANIQVFVRPITGRTRPAGMYLRSALGGDMVVIGSYFGRGASFPAENTPEPPDSAGMDSLLRSLSRPCFIMDLRELPSAGILHEWFQAAHETRAGPGVTTRVAPLGAYDGILYIDTINPTSAPPKH